jgi:hypothetical protein
MPLAAKLNVAICKVENMADVTRLKAIDRQQVPGSAPLRAVAPLHSGRTIEAWGLGTKPYHAPTA